LVAPRERKRLLQQLEMLRHEGRAEERRTGHIAAGPSEARDEAIVHRIAHRRDDAGDGSAGSAPAAPRGVLI
jgi:hypothetical protein